MLISEVVRLSGLSKDGVRHYESLGLIRSTPKQAGTRVYREYAPDVIETIKLVRQAQQLGLSLKEVGPVLERFFKTPPTHEQIVSFLEERLAVIREKLNELRVIEAFIEAKLMRYRDSAKAAAPKVNSTISCSTRHTPVAKPRNGLGRK